MQRPLRRLRQLKGKIPWEEYELLDLGLTGKAVEELDEKITTVIDEVVEESIKVVLIKYTSGDGRKNELHNALETDFRRLFGQIERGLTMEFRAEPKTDADNADQQSLNAIVDLSRKMQFPEGPAKTPLLLTDSVVIEGEINHKITRKTTRTQTTKTQGNKRESKEE